MAKIKICGLYRNEDIEYVNKAKPDYCGFIVDFPKSHRNVSPERLKELAAGVSGDIKRVGVFVDEAPETVARLLADGVIDIAQLHGHEDEAYISLLRQRVPGCIIWKAFKVREAGDLAAAQSSTADMVLLDNGYGTGKCFDWTLAQKFDREFILAGGLTPENIPEALVAMKPYAVDISSGVETDKIKDRSKMLAAVSAVREA